jgi:hypothetical protein
MGFVFYRAPIEHMLEKSAITAFRRKRAKSAFRSTKAGFP